MSGRLTIGIAVSGVTNAFGVPFADRRAAPAALPASRGPRERASGAARDVTALRWPMRHPRARTDVAARSAEPAASRRRRPGARARTRGKRRERTGALTVYRPVAGRVPVASGSAACTRDANRTAPRATARRPHDVARHTQPLSGHTVRHTVRASTRLVRAFRSSVLAPPESPVP